MTPRQLRDAANTPWEWWERPFEDEPAYAYFLEHCRELGEASMRWLYGLAKSA